MNNRLAMTIAFVLLVVMICTVAVNSFYIHTVIDEMHSMLSSLPDTPDGAHERVAALNDYWKSQRATVGLSVSHLELDTLSDLLDNLTVASRENNEYEYKRSMALLSRAIDNIGRLEKFSAENLF